MKQPKIKSESISVDEYKGLNTQRRRGIGQEDHMHIQFGCLMQKYKKMGKMPDVISWSYFPAGEYRKKPTASMLKKKGTAAGWPDYIFFIYDKRKSGVSIYFLEFKTEIGKQQKTQQDFQLSFAGSSNTSYHVIRSVQEAVELFEDAGILLTN